MSVIQGFQFVTNISREGADKISFWVGDVLAFDRHSRSRETKVLLFAGLFVVIGVIVFIGGIFGAIAMVLALVGLAVGMMALGDKTFFTQKKLEYDRGANKLTIIEAYFNTNIIIEELTQLKIAVRYHPVGDYSIKQLSLDVVGVDSEDRGTVSNYCLVDYRYTSLKKAQSQCCDAANAFQFLADWLNLPLIIEPQIMYEDSRGCPHLALHQIKIHATYNIEM